jgi:hypothetical protein
MRRSTGGCPLWILMVSPSAEHDLAATAAIQKIFEEGIGLGQMVRPDLDSSNPKQIERGEWTGPSNFRQPAS